ncbi:MAG: DUF4870 domain-containing protein [Anaerolineae bacterium]|jgi:uncharacterized Tic20 family protein
MGDAVDEQGQLRPLDEDGAKLDGRAVETERQSSPSDDWTIAALTHASVLLTLLLALAGGVGALVGLAVPLIVYLSYRERSGFIAFHALQSLVYQGAGMLLYIVLLAVAATIVAAAWAISGALSAVIIGFLLMPLALMITIGTAIVLLGAPLLLLGYGLYGAYKVYQGEDFRYELLGEWLDREVKV